MTVKEKFMNNGWMIHKLSNVEPVERARRILDSHFSGEPDTHCTDLYRERLLACQDEINAAKVHRDIVTNEKSLFDNLFDSVPLALQSVVYLRGVRPKSDEMMEFLDFHRENFYCDHDYINSQINMVVPLRNFNSMTSMEYIDKSHRVPDSAIVTKKYSSEESGVERFSTGHRLGLSYNPKKITAGVDLESAKRINLADDEVFIFSSRLIHGGGSNLTNKVRFSLDFGIINDSAIGEMKKEHFAAYNNIKSHYVGLAEY